MLRKPRRRARPRIASISCSVSTTRKISPLLTASPQLKFDSGAGNMALRAASASGSVNVNALRCITPSTSRNTVVDSASTSRFDRAAIASNTGCTSEGELAMTFRMSAVAVCRSSASLVSLNRRAFSMAITAWSAKICSSASSSAVKGARRSRCTRSAPMAPPSRRSGVPDTVRVPAARPGTRPGHRAIAAGSSASGTWTWRLSR